MDFDILLKRGLLADGSGAPMRDADVGIVGDRIARIGDLDLKSAKEEIDCRGKVVAPGFVDIHGHSDYFLLVEPGSPNKLLQGVTTEIGGNCGYSAAPISDEMSAERGESLDRNFGLRPDWNTLDEYYAKLKKVGPALNFGILAGHNTVRASVMSGAARPPDDDEKAAMSAMLVEAMESGALGMSTGLIYPPGCFADREELAELCLPVARYGGFFATHMRSEGRELIESVEEVLYAARKSGVRLEISHIKTSGPKNWSKIDDVVSIIDGAREDGVDVACDRYPYTASFTGLSAVLPSWVFEGSRQEFRHRLTDGEIRTRLKREIIKDNGADYLDRVVVAQTFGDTAGDIEGKSVVDAAYEKNMDPYEFLFDILAKDGSEPTAVYHTMSDENMMRFLALPYSMIGSDASVRAPEGPLGVGKPHPRAYGCFTRFLKIVRERGIMPLETAVAKMTSMPARAARIGKRGLVETGHAADITVFDPDNVADTATYDDPHRYSKGIEHVLVNGVFAVRDGDITGKRTGRIVLRNNALEANK